jgi:GT2 family glycosyltransferase
VSKENYRISVLIPVFNAPDRVEALLESIAASDDIGYIDEILIGDDESDLKTQSILNRKAADISALEVVRHNQNLGYLKNINALFRRAKGDIVILLNSDTLVPHKWITRIVDCFRSDESIALATPLSTNASFVTVHPASGQSWRDVDIIASTFPPAYPDLPSAIGFCLAIRKSLIQREALLNEEYAKGYWEDTELHYYARDCGYRSVCIDNLLIYHANGSSSFSISHDLEAINDTNRAIFMRQYGKKYLSAVSNFQHDDPIQRYRAPSSIQSSFERVDGIDFLFVLPAVVRNIGGIHVVLRLVEVMQRHGIRAGIYCFGAVDLSFVGHLGFSYPFVDIRNIKDVVTTVKYVVATSFDSFKYARKIKSEFDSKLIYFVQGPEAAFSNGVALADVATDYKEADQIITVSPFLKRYVKNLSGATAHDIRMGPQDGIFYPSENIERDPLSIAVCIRHDSLKGTGHALYNAALAANAGFKLHFFGQDLPESLEDIGEHHGQLSHRKIGRLLASVGYYLDCSLMEGLGLLPLEGAFSGAIPILAQPNGLDHVVQDRVNSFILPSHFENAEFFAELFKNTSVDGNEAVRRAAIAISQSVNEDLGYSDFVSPFKNVGGHYKVSAQELVVQSTQALGRNALMIQDILDSRSWKIAKLFRVFASILARRRYREPKIPTNAHEQEVLLLGLLSSTSWAITLPIRKIRSIQLKLRNRMKNS